MKKAAIVLIFLVSGFMRSLDAQVAVSVTNPLNASPNLATSYVSLSDAITALNAVTSLTGPVILTCAAGGAETAPAGGYVISYTATGSSSNTIVIDGNGSTITAFSPQTAGQIHNAIFKIVGCDYLTLQNFVMTENAGNTVNTLGTNTKTEFGVALFLASATNGAQNNTIQNNTITLSSTYQNAIGIFSTSSSSQINGTLEASATSGTNSNNRFYGNTISSVAYGMYFICPQVTATIFESGTDIGGTSSATKNTITFGLATASDFVWNRFSGVKPAGIYFRNGGYGSSVRYNSISSNNLAYSQSGGVAGIVTTNGTGTNPSGVTYTTNWSDNELISISNTGTTQVSGIDFGYGLNTGTLIANNNVVTVTSNATAARSAAIQGINAPYAAASITANGNTITVNEIFRPATSLTNSSPLTALDVSGATASLSASSNNITVNQTNGPTAAVSATMSGAAIGINLSAAIASGSVFNNTILISQTASMSSGTSTMNGTTTAIQATTASTAITIGSSGNGNTITMRQVPSATGTSNFSGDVRFINSQLHTNLNVSSNNLNTSGGKLYSTAPVYGVSYALSASTSTLNISNNIINIDNTGAASSSSVFYGLYGTSTVSGTLSGGYSVNNNDITLASKTTAATVGLYDNNGASATTISKDFLGNTITINHSTGTSAPVTGIYTDKGTNNAGSLAQPNVITLASSAISPTFYGMNTGSTGSANVFNFVGNTINPVAATAASTSAPTFTGIRIVSGTTNTISNNSIKGNSTGASTGSATINGIEITGGTTNNVSDNRIYDLGCSATGGSGIISGIRISGGTNNNVFNNLIGLSPAMALSSTDAVRGINIISTVASSTQNIYYNTVYLNATSTGTNFGSSGIYHTISTTGTTSALDMRNNIFVNISQQKGTGMVVAFRRSAGAANNLANYSNTSGNNIFYAGTPASGRLIYNDGTSSAQTIADYRCGVFTAGTVMPRDQVSETENVSFQSVNGADAQFLHINPAVQTFAEGRAMPLASVQDDFDSDSRDATTPDIGADEGSFSGFALPVPLSGIVDIPVDYPTLTGCGGLFAAIAARGLSGNLTVNISSNLTEPGTFGLFQWNESGSGGYTLTINPNNTTERLISGSVAQAMIRIDGADRVVIDGQFNNDGLRHLRFRNSNTSNPAISYTNDATNNTLKYCVTESANTSTTGGTIVIGTSSGTSGNDNIVITNNHIRDRSDASGFPVNAIYASGTAGKVNENVTISDNEIYNFWSASTATNGVLVSGNNSDWTLSGNSFYQTGSRTQTTGASHSAIKIDNTSGNNFSVTGNYIGGSSALAGGTPWTVSGTVANVFIPVYLNVGSTVVSSVQGNTIRNINWQTASNTAVMPGVFTAIAIPLNGWVNVDGNTIGNTTGINSIIITTATTGTNSYGIGNTSSNGAVSITSNTIGAIAVMGSSNAVSHNFTGIFYGQGASGSTRTISGNLIGSTTSVNSIQAATVSNSSTAQSVIGIRCNGGGKSCNHQQ